MTYTALRHGLLTLFCTLAISLPTNDATAQPDCVLRPGATPPQEKKRLASGAGGFNYQVGAEEELSGLLGVVWPALLALGLPWRRQGRRDA